MSNFVYNADMEGVCWFCVDHWRHRNHGIAEEEKGIENLDDAVGENDRQNAGIYRLAGGRRVV